MAEYLPHHNSKNKKGKKNSTHKTKITLVRLQAALSFVICGRGASRRSGRYRSSQSAVCRVVSTWCRTAHARQSTSLPVQLINMAYCAPSSFVSSITRDKTRGSEPFSVGFTYPGAQWRHEIVACLAARSECRQLGPARYPNVIGLGWLIRVSGKFPDIIINVLLTDIFLLLVPHYLCNV